MSGWHRCIASVGLVAGLLLFNSVTMPMVLKAKREAGMIPTAETVLKHLANGAYQFCTEPDPQDWRDGAGACLNFVKQGTDIDGYYGYPHSDGFVCLQGRVSDNWFEGKGLVIVWAGSIVAEMPRDEVNWGKQDRLYLGKGNLVHREGMGKDQIAWIVFRKTRLNMKGLYPYASPRMTPATQLCDWHFSE